MMKELNDPLPKRTQATNLTDDELLLLDALFQCSGICTSQLFVVDYHFHMNTGYTHGLTDAQVLDTFRRWDQAGWINILFEDVIDDESKQWEMSETGAKMWEQERNPIWDRFVRCWSYFDDLDDLNYTGINENFLKASWKEPVTVIASPTLSIAEAYLEIAIASHVVIPRSSERDYTVLHQEKEAHKVFEDMHCLFVLTIGEDEAAPQGTPGNMITDWESFHRNRIWWNSIDDLDTLTIST